MQLKVKPMKKYVVAIVIAFGALFGLSVQAAPLSSNAVAVQTVQAQVAKESAATKVWYYRRWGYYRPYYRPHYYRPYYRPYRYYRPYYRRYYWRRW